MNSVVQRVVRLVPIKGNQKNTPPSNLSKPEVDRLGGSGAYPSVVPDGLEKAVDSKGKRRTSEKLTPNPTPSESEHKLLNLFRQLTRQQKQRLVRQLEAQCRQPQSDLETAGE